MKKLVVLLSISVACIHINAQNKISKKELNEVQRKIDEFAVIDLKYDIRKLHSHERAILPILLTAAEIADSLFWLQSYGSQTALMSRMGNDTLKRFATINYGPWERLNGNAPFVSGFPNKPKGAQFYPSNITDAEFDAFNDSSKQSIYNSQKETKWGFIYSIIL